MMVKNKIKQATLIIMSLLSALILSGCDYTLMNPQGMIAADEKRILIIAVLLMLIVVIPVIVMTLLFSWRYRENNTNASYAPEWSHSNLIEVVCWSIPCIIIIILGIITWNSSHRLDPYRPLNSTEKPIVIQAIAYDWKWLFIYPEQKIATVNYVQFPVGVPVKFLITANGAMNAFQIPHLAGQIYAMAGMRTKLHLIADKTGDYPGFSANFSGDGFADMKFTAHVSTKEGFAAWVKTVKQSPIMLTASEYSKLEKPSANNPVQYYSSVNKDIFETVVMKSMMPVKDINNVCNTKLLTSLGQ